MALIDSSSEEMQSAPKQKKRYEKPSFRFEEVFVTSALTCGKVGGELSCQTGGLSAS